MSHPNGDKAVSVTIDSASPPICFVEESSLDVRRASSSGSAGNE